MDIPISKLGPKVLIFHETQYTDPLDAADHTVWVYFDFRDGDKLKI